MFGSGGSSSGLSRPDPVKQSRMGSEVVGFFFPSSVFTGLSHSGWPGPRLYGYL